MTVTTIRRTTQIAAAFLAALVLPTAASAADVQFSAGIVAAERARAADNGSADVKIAAPADAVAVNAALGTTDAKTADVRAPVGHAAEKRAPVGYAAEKRAPVGYAAEKRAPVGYAAEKRAPVGYAAEKRAPIGYAAEKRAPIGRVAE